jgi:hypothetical protein
MFVLCSCRENSGYYELINDSSETILYAKVRICNQESEFRNLPPGKMEGKKYRVTSDSHYVVLVRFESGKEILKEIGYVTNGFDFANRITILRDEVTLSTIPH